MPTFIVKPKREEDYYVLWSTVVDAPTGGGTREQISAKLAAPSAGIVIPGDSVERRLLRADDSGSSTTGGIATWFDWDQERFIFEQLGWVQRKDLAELTRLLQTGKSVEHLITPFNDEETK